VDNVLSNALKFAPAGSVITVSSRLEDGDVVIEITDAGPGFPLDLLPVAFERFRRGDAARTRAADDGPIRGGAGLGLAIVQGVLRAHLGEARAANRREPATGAVVTLRFPAAGPHPRSSRAQN
jgi:signal transduction histidine kinase